MEKVKYFWSPINLHTVRVETMTAVFYPHHVNALLGVTDRKA